MTGRERLTAILQKQPLNELSWTTLVDGATLDALPPPLKGCSEIEFYRHLGCDILLLNGWTSQHQFRSPELRWGPDVKTTQTQENGRRVTQLATPQGTLKGISERGHPIKYLVENLDDLRIYRALWEGAQYVERDDLAACDALNALVGQDGIVTRFWGPSTIPRLLETDAGTVSFYYLLNDHPQEMEGLIRLMHEKELRAFEILAQHPCETVILCENTSTYYISPDVYRRFNGPHVKDFVDIVRAAGKLPLIHMCGHVRNILEDIRKTGLAGVHALTPPPTGDTPWETGLDVLGEDQIIIGILDPSIFEVAPVRQIGLELDALYTPRLRRAHFVLWPGADGHRVPLERFEAVARWMERNGNRS